MKITRWEFLKSIAGIAALFASRSALSDPLGLPLGIQLMDVRNDLSSDFAPTLRKLAAMGYRQVEAHIVPDTGQIDYNGGTPGEFRKMLNDAGLKISSCHFGTPKDDSEWARNIEAAHTLGLEYMVCSEPWPPLDASESRPAGTQSLETWKRIAKFLNHLGTLCQRSGIEFAYHNHNAEYRVYDGVVAYDELLRSTDPALVKMEMDCFWTTYAGKDPVSYLQKYPGRILLLHIKDLKPGYKPNFEPVLGVRSGKDNPFCEVGSGTIDWKRIFAAAPHIKHYYVEQDYCDRPCLESAHRSAEYLKALEI
jgi:sugar phosphate isomerase/epimerase